MAKAKLEMNYESYYRRWHDGSPEHEARQLGYFRRLLRDRLSEDLSGPVLDVGCGCGHLLEVLRQWGYRQLLGIDRDPALVASTRVRGIEAELVVDAGEFLAAHPRKFDMIFACDVLEHIPRDRQLNFCRSLAAALRPDGRLLLTVPNANSAIAARWRYNDLTHYLSFTESSLDHLLHLSGLIDIEVSGSELMDRPSWPLLPTPRRWRWQVLKSLRGFRRLEMIAEFGREDGLTIPLTPNLLATARAARS